MKDYMKTERSVTLTQEQWCNITMLILTTTHYRKHEVESWERLAGEKDNNGNALYKTAASNAEYYRKMDESLKEIRRIIDGY